VKGSNGRARLLAGTAAVVVLAVVAAAVVLVVGRSQAAPRPVALPSFTPHPAATVMNAQVRQRVVQILTEMHRKAFNPDAPPPKSSSGLTGGLFINWSASWDGNLGSAVANTNYQSNGKTDSESGAAPRHDPFTDLVYLRNLLGYRAANPSDHSFDGDIALMAPIVKSDFANYSYYKCNLYDELEDMQSFDPGGGWGAMADGFAAIVYTKFYDPALGTVVGGSDGSYRVDYAAACAVAKADSARSGDARRGHRDGAARDARRRPRHPAAAAAGDGGRRAPARHGRAEAGEDGGGGADARRAAGHVRADARQRISVGGAVGGQLDVLEPALRPP
jgi:hypothetical protein